MDQFERNQIIKQRIEKFCKQERSIEKIIQKFNLLINLNNKEFEVLIPEKAYEILVKGLGTESPVHIVNMSKQQIKWIYFEGIGRIKKFATLLDEEEENSPFDTGHDLLSFMYRQKQKGNIKNIKKEEYDI